MLDFVLYTCSYGGVTPATIVSVEKLHATPLRFEWWFQTDDALIGRSRSIAVTEYLKKPRAPYMIFLDGDIIFVPMDIQRILDAMATGLDVVGGLYPVKGAKYLAQRGFEGKMKIDGEIQEAQFVSTGFVGISLKILQEVTKEMPLLNEGSWAECYPVFEAGRYEKIYISEDWDFCNKVRQAGSKVYAHTGVMCGHLKEAVFTAQQAIERTARKPESSLKQDLTDYLGKDIKNISESQAMKMLADKWNTREGTEEFYRDPEVQELYLCDLMWLNLSPVYDQTRLSAIKNAERKNILDIGCGLGTVLLDLCWKNRKLAGYDLNTKALDFARYRAGKLGATNVEFTSEWPDISEFDLILAIDTLEHIEDLRSFLMKLGGEMKSGARLYHFDCFGNQEQSPMHFDHSEHIDDWVKEAGLVIFDAHWCIKP